MFSEEYIKLCLRLNKHIPGLVDAYFGPGSLKNVVDSEEAVPLPRLRDTCRELTDLARSTGDDPYLRFFRIKQVDAMATQIDRLLGQAQDYHAYIRRLFDIDLDLVDEAVIDEHHRQIAALLQRLGYGGEPVEAVRRWEAANEIGGDELKDLVLSTSREARKRTRRIIPLPKGEKVTVEMVHNNPWSGYNWYQGGYRSLVQVNLDLPRNRFEAEELAYHEAYPGHHTDHSSKEKALYRERGLLEASIILINTPSSVLGEGLASVAGRFIEDREPDDARRLYQLLNRVRRACDTNGTISLHANGAQATDVAEYLERRGLMSSQRAAKRMEFLTNPLWSSYSFTYWFGSRIVEDAYIRAKSANRSDEFYKLLYRELSTPSTLAERLRNLC